MAVVVLTLTRRAQISAAVLSTPVAVCSSGAMQGAKIWRWAMYAASSRSLMFNVLFGLLSGRMWDCMVVLNVSRHTCPSLDEL